MVLITGLEFAASLLRAVTSWSSTTIPIHELRGRIHHPPESLPFGETLVENPDIRVEVERIVPTHETALPFFWVWGSEPEVFMEVAEDEPDVTHTRLLAEVENGALFRAEWAPTAEIISGLKQLNATIIDSEGTAERWKFEVRAEERERFLEFLRLFKNQGIPISLERLYDLSDVIEMEHRKLTSTQRETLLAAYERGYFDRPRQVTQKELAEEFDVTARAISERLRRATRNLIESSLLPSADNL